MNAEILLVDDNDLVRFAYAKILERNQKYRIVGEAANGQEAIKIAASRHLDLIIMDVLMPGKSGTDATREILGKHPDVKILVVSGYPNSEHVYAAVEAGAHGFVPKLAAKNELVRGVRAVLSGRSYFSKELPFDARAHSQGLLDRSPLSKLSVREKQVVKMVAEGMEYNEIAALLGVNTKTIATYKWRAMCKLGIDSVPGLIKFAILHNMIPL